MTQSGGCLCGDLRYSVEGEPEWVTTCYCRFCQSATGSDYMVEPLFPISSFRYTQGTPRIYDHRSGGSGKTIHVHFCGRCGTKVQLTFERFPESCGVYAGTFDDPGWFKDDRSNAWQIFLSKARPGVIVRPGIESFQEHGMTNSGELLEPTIYHEPHVIRARDK